MVLQRFENVLPFNLTKEATRPSTAGQYLVKKHDITKVNKEIIDKVLSFKCFPGARRIGLPFKDAVETYLKIKFSNRIFKGLKKTDIWREDKKLYKAMNNYKARFGSWPVEIPSERDDLNRTLDVFFEHGPDALAAKERIAVARKGKRILSSLRG